MFLQRRLASDGAVNRALADVVSNKPSGSDDASTQYISDYEAQAERLIIATSAKRKRELYTIYRFPMRYCFEDHHFGALANIRVYIKIDRLSLPLPYQSKLLVLLPRSYLHSCQVPKMHLRYAGLAGQTTRNLLALSEPKTQELYRSFDVATERHPNVPVRTLCTTPR